MTDWQGVLERLNHLYREVDHDAVKLENTHGDRLKCGRGCCDCCVDELTVFEVEAENIRQSVQDVLAGDPGDLGKCAFLNGEGACRIYSVRPYVCRTQGLPLRWFDVDEQGNDVELRDICPLNEEGTPLEILSADACWELGNYEGRLAMLQSEVGDGEMKRVVLRDLFEEKGDG